MDTLNVYLYICSRTHKKYSYCEELHDGFTVKSLRMTKKCMKSYIHSMEAGYIISMGWFSSRLQYLQCVSNEDTAVSH